MQGFFQGFNLVRALILVFLVGSIPMGMQVWKREKQIQTLAEATGFDRDFQVRSIEKSDMVRTIKSIISKARTHSALQEVLEDEGIDEDTTPMSYIRGLAKNKNINLGRLEINTSTKDTWKGVTDRIFKISPQDPKARFRRPAISNFLFKLEDDSRRVRVTGLNIQATRDDGRRPDTTEIPSDSWTFDCEITIRDADPRVAQKP